MDKMKNTMTKGTWSRRDFLARLGAGGTAAAIARQGGVFSRPAMGAAVGGSRRKPGRMAVGCVSWCFRGIGQGPPWDDAIEIIGGMGFDGIELIVSRAEDLDNYWKEPQLSGVRRLLEKHKLRVSQFVLFQQAVAGLSSLDRDERARNLDIFERGCRVGAKLDSPFINIVAPWAQGLRGPQGYLPRYYAVSGSGPEPKFHIDIPEDFDYERVWETFAETMKAATERAKASGLRFSLEHHTHTLVPDADAFLRLRDRVRDPALGYNIDIGWTQLGREYPPIAIHKTKRCLVNAHIRDIDGPGLRFVGIGAGCMDFRAVVDTLKQIGFSGFLTIEQDSVPDMKGVVSGGLRMLRELIGRGV